MSEIITGISKAIEGNPIPIIIGIIVLIIITLFKISKFQTSLNAQETSLNYQQELLDKQKAFLEKKLDEQNLLLNNQKLLLDEQNLTLIRMLNKIETMAETISKKISPVPKRNKKQVEISPTPEAEGKI